ncbi:hypothetical protein PD5205_00212 [Xanthomonas fragariae]|uniref:Uncharacterized protein n=1 Tax=Xanthomonas fragariae TaxID=48664 RepID=A0A1Y6HJD1_9XANT|nr:hypothetical protein PD5205_00212 [Xanthomonas fragariae]
MAIGNGRLRPIKLSMCSGVSKRRSCGRRVTHQGSFEQLFRSTTEAIAAMRKCLIFSMDDRRVRANSKLTRHVVDYSEVLSQHVGGVTRRLRPADRHVHRRISGRLRRRWHWCVEPQLGSDFAECHPLRQTFAPEGIRGDQVMRYRPSKPSSATGSCRWGCHRLIPTAHHRPLARASVASSKR